jgi:hypothetical protein
VKGIAILVSGMARDMTLTRVNVHPSWPVLHGNSCPIQPYRLRRVAWIGHLNIVPLRRRIFRSLMIDGGCRSIMIGIPNSMAMFGLGNPYRYLGSRGTLIGQRETLGYIPLV